MARARLAVLALAIFAAPAGAQAVTGSALLASPAPVAVEAAAAAPAADVAAGPSLASMPAAARHAESTGPLRIMAPARANMGQAKAMMIVGAAAFVAGAIIGDTPGTIIMVGGAAVGLVGLYQYLQ